MANQRPGCFPESITAFPGPYEYTNKLPTGTWNMLANGRIYELEIHRVSGHDVDADLSSGTLQDVEWSAVANASTVAKLSFTRVVENVGLKQRFHGFLLHYDDSDPFWRLVGTFGKLDTEGEHVEAGWYATLPKR